MLVKIFVIMPNNYTTVTVLDNTSRCYMAEILLIGRLCFSTNV